MRGATKLLIVTLLAGAVLFLLVRDNQRLQAFRAATQEAAARAQRLRADLANAHLELDKAESQTEIARSARNSVHRLLSKERAAHTPEADKPEFSQPPSDWPKWEMESPYVWIRKELLKDLPIAVFEPSGVLTRDMGTLLALNKEDLRGLNAELARVAGAYQELEAAQAVISTNHLERNPGEKLTVVVQPDPAASAKLEEEFKGVLRRRLSPQQFDLVAGVGSGWISQNLRPKTDEPKIYSVSRQPNGTFGITIKAGDSWMSTSGTDKLSLYIPKHLMSLFASMQER